MGWYHENTLGLGGWIGMGLGTLLFWGLLVILVVALVRWVGAAGRTTMPAVTGGPTGVAPAAAVQHEHALHILEDRFARGEIAEEEYLHRREVLLGR